MPKSSPAEKARTGIRHFRAFPLCVLILILGSADASAEPNLRSEFQNSQASWLEAKAANGDSYEYSSTFTSWVGFQHRTVITVQTGTVVSRSYFEKARGNKEEILVFSENEKNLNAHQQGFPAITMDQIYRDCGEKYLMTNRRSNTHYFRTNKGSVLELCGYVPKNCADDCFIGVRIPEFRWLP